MALWTKGAADPSGLLSPFEAREAGGGHGARSQVMKEGGRSRKRDLSQLANLVGWSNERGSGMWPDCDESWILTQKAGLT